MILADKIINLRKKFGWSQEELAEKLNVSRQSISKWEGARSIPDMSKILLLSEIFGVSTDYLLKDEMEETDGSARDIDSDVLRISLEQATEYVEMKRLHSKLVVKGVFLCITAITPLMTLLALTNLPQVNLSTDIATAIGLISLFLMIVVAIGFFVRTNQYNASIEKIEKNEFEIEYGVKGVFKERVKEYKQTYMQATTMGIAMFLISFLPLVTVALLGMSDIVVLFMVVVLMFFIAIGVSIIVPASTKYNAYNLIISEDAYAPHKRKENKRAEKVGAFYWPLVVAVYLGWSFWTMAWGITWIIWPVASLLFVAVLGFVGLFESDQK